MAVFDCDLVGSVRTQDFAGARPEGFFQCGIQEHHTAACAGACSKDAVLTWWADFGVFGVDETYNIHRLSDINHTQLKLVCTHCGLDVGEDGKTHQCIDYVGVFANLFGYRVIVPADANQTDRAVRFMAREPGSFVLAVGRSKLPVILDEKGAPAFAGGYEFRYGAMDLLRRGAKENRAALIAMGQVAGEALKAAESLEEEGIPVSVWSVATPLEIDRRALRKAAASGAVVTVEDHHVRTGLGAQVARALAEEGLAVSFRALGVTGFACSGSVPSLYAQTGIDASGIAEAVKEAASARAATVGRTTREAVRTAGKVAKKAVKKAKRAKEARRGAKGRKKARR
jgi:transketolase